MPKHCECEHINHPDDLDTPRHTNYHKFFAEVTSTVKVDTPFGPYEVCMDCATDCLHRYKIIKED